MRPNVSQSNVVPVSSDGIKDAQKRSLGVADYAVRRDVAVDVHQIESSIDVERFEPHAIQFFLYDHLARESHEFQQVRREYHGGFWRITYLHADSIETLVEREFCGNARYVGERSGDLMSQTGCERLAVVVETGFGIHLGERELIRDDVVCADPVFLGVVIDIVSRVTVDDFRNAELVIVVQTYSFR
jgi:hypothetical protein